MSTISIASHFLAAEPGRGQQHCFSRDLASHFCVACQDAWPGNDGVVSKFHKCSNCGLSVHTGCRYIAKRCYPCVPNAAHPKLLSADLLTLETRGRIMCQLLHAFDVPLPDGTSLYGVFKISVSDEIIKSSPEVLSGHECVWSTPEGRGGGERGGRRPGEDDDGTGGASSSSSGSGGNTLSVSANAKEPHSNGIVYLHKTPDMLTEDDYEHSLEWFWSYDRERAQVPGPGATGSGAGQAGAPSSSASICSPPLVELEIWKSSLYGLFDTMIMSARISVLPLLLHPNVAIERWFRLKFVEDGRSGGSALVRMAFAPIACPTSSSSSRGGINSNNVRASLTPLLLSPRSSAREDVDVPQPEASLSTNNRQESQRTMPKPLALVEPLSPGPEARTDIREAVGAYSPPPPPAPQPPSMSSLTKPVTIRDRGFDRPGGEIDAMVPSAASTSMKIIEPVIQPAIEFASPSPKNADAVTDMFPKSLVRSLDREMSTVDNRTQIKEQFRKDTTSVSDATVERSYGGSRDNAVKMNTAVHLDAGTKTNDFEAERKTAEVISSDVPSGYVINSEGLPREKISEPSYQQDKVVIHKRLDHNITTGGETSAAPVMKELLTINNDSDFFDEMSAETIELPPAETQYSEAEEVARSAGAVDQSIEKLMDVSVPNKETKDRSSSNASSRALVGATAADPPTSVAREPVKPPPQQQQQQQQQDEDKGSEGAFGGWFARTARQLQSQISALVNDEGYRAPAVKPQRRVITSADASAGVSFISSDSEDNAKSVGKLSIKLIDAYRTDVRDAAEGDYFAVVSIVDIGGVVATTMPSGPDGGTPPEVVLLEEETQIVRNNAAPRFNRYFEFDVPHFRCSLRFTLIEAQTGRKIGVSQMSVFSLIQRDSNMKLARIRDQIWSKAKLKGANSSNSRSSAPAKRLHETETTAATKAVAEGGLRQRVGYSNRLQSDSGVNFSANGDVSSTGSANKATNISDIDSDEAALELLPLRDAATNSTVLGRFNAVIRFQENSKDLFSAPKPLLALPSPPEPFSTDRLKEHIGRVKRVFGIFKDVTREHDRIMQWEDPLYTLFLFVFFVYACLRLDAEYALCVPLFLVVVLMTRSLYRRSAGELERRVIERPPDRDDSTYKPHAVLRVAVCGFKNFTKKSFLSSNPYPMPSFIKISYLPNALTPPITGPAVAGASVAESQRQTEFIIGIAPVSQNSGAGRQQTSALEAGHFAPSPGKKLPIATSSIAGAAPSGLSGLLSQLNIISGDTVRDGMLHNMCDPWPRPLPDRGADLAFVYPMLQPESKKKHALPEPADEFDAAWLESEGAIRFSLLNGDQAASFVDGGVLGSILVPVKELLVAARALGHKSDGTQSSSSSGPFVPLPELAVWCPVKWTSTATASSHFTFDALNTADIGMPIDSSSPAKPSSDASPTSAGVAFSGRFYHEVAHPLHGADGGAVAPTDVPLVLLRMQLQLRDNKRPPSDEEIEISRTLQTMLSEAPVKSGGTISTLMGVPEMAKSVQNGIGSAVSKLESLSNVFNWTVPDKTIYVYVVFVVLWLVTCLIPGRYIILGVGIFDFFYAFMPQPKDFPMQTKVANALQAIPNADDLEQVYAVERRQFLQKVVEKDRARSREARLRVGLDCRWEGVVFLKSPTSLGAAPPSLGTVPAPSGSSNATAPSGGQSALAALFADPVFVKRLWGFGWAQMFLVVQGHRVVWWQNVNDVDEGASPLGQIVLFGHAGTTQASPVEMREVASLSSWGPEAAAAFARGCLLCVFGRSGPDGAPAKVSLLCTDPEARQALEAAASQAIVVG